MSNEALRNLLAQAAEKGWKSFDSLDARAILASQEILAKNPEHEAAKIVLETFKQALKTNVWNQTFAVFLIAEDALRTDEEKAEDDRRRKAFLERQSCGSTL